MKPITIEQIAQIGLLDAYFKMRNKHLLSEFFRTQNIWEDDLLADKECYTFFRRYMPTTLTASMSISPASMSRR